MWTRSFRFKKRKRSLYQLPESLRVIRQYGGVCLKKNSASDRENAASTEKKYRQVSEKCLWSFRYLEFWKVLSDFLSRKFSYKKQKIEEKKYTKWFDYDKIKNSPCVRTRRQGDYLTVNSEGGRKKLNRIFIDEKIPAEMRDRLPVVAVGSEILWIPGGRMNEKYKITSTTGRVLELHYQGGALA